MSDTIGWFDCPDCRRTVLGPDRGPHADGCGNWHAEHAESDRRSSDCPRPANGYALSLYDQLRRDIREFRAEIAWRRNQIADHSAHLTVARWALVEAEGTLKWMAEHQADEIAELEAARARVRAILRRTDR